MPGKKAYLRNQLKKKNTLDKVQNTEIAKAAANENINTSEAKTNLEKNQQIDLKTSYAKTLSKIYLLHKEEEKLNQQLKSGRVTSATGFTIEYDIDNKFENGATFIWKKTTQDSVNKLLKKQQALMAKIETKFSMLTAEDRERIKTEVQGATEKKDISEKGRAYINKILLGR